LYLSTTPALPNSVNTLVAKLAEAMSRRDSASVLSLYDWQKAEQMKVRRSSERREWSSLLADTRKLQGRLVLKCIDMSPPTAWDDLPGDLDETVRALTVELSTGGKTHRARAVIDVGKKEARLLRWPWVANLTPLAMRHITSFGLRERLDIRVPVERSDGTVQQVFLQSFVMDRLGIPQAAAKKRDFVHQNLAMMMGGPQRSVPVYLCKLRSMGKKDQQAREWSYCLVFRVKEDGLHLAAFLPVEDAARWSVDLIDWSRLPPLELKESGK